MTSKCVKKPVKLFPYTQFHCLHSFGYGSTSSALLVLEQREKRRKRTHSHVRNIYTQTKCSSFWCLYKFLSLALSQHKLHRLTGLIKRVRFISVFGHSFSVWLVYSAVILAICVRQIIIFLHIFHRDRLILYTPIKCDDNISIETKHHIKVWSKEKALKLLCFFKLFRNHSKF